MYFKNKRISGVSSETTQRFNQASKQKCIQVPSLAAAIRLASHFALISAGVKANSDTKAAAAGEDWANARALAQITSSSLSFAANAPTRKLAPGRPKRREKKLTEVAGWM